MYNFETCHYYEVLPHTTQQLQIYSMPMLTTRHSKMQKGMAHLILLVKQTVLGSFGPSTSIVQAWYLTWYNCKTKCAEFLNQIGIALQMNC